MVDVVKSQASCSSAESVLSLVGCRPEWPWRELVEVGRELITFPKPPGLKARKAKGLQWETDIISKGEHVSRWQEPNRQRYTALEALLAMGCPLLTGEVPQASPEPPGASKTLLPLGFVPGSPYHPVPLASLSLGFQRFLACLSCGCLVRTEAFISPTPTRKNEQTQILKGQQTNLWQFCIT